MKKWRWATAAVQRLVGIIYDGGILFHSTGRALHFSFQSRKPKYRRVESNILRLLGDEEKVSLGFPVVGLCVYYCNSSTCIAKVKTELFLKNKK